MTVRKNQANLSSFEKKAFVDAVLELKRRGRYDAFVTTHRRQFNMDMFSGQPVGHLAPSFLPWHRQYLRDFERELQSIDWSVSIPYWDWTTDNTVTAALWAPDFLGGTGRDLDYQVMDGPFAHSAGNWPITVQDDSNPFLARSLAGRVTTLPTRAQTDAVLAIPEYDTAPWNESSAGGFRNHLEGGTAYQSMHNRVHIWIGGQMAQSVSPNDPVFWLHHAFIDKLWADWQRLHPGSAHYLPGGNTTGTVDLNETMPPWNTVTPSDLLDHTRHYTYA
ncbi:tyrosinase family protein [Streptomyces sp. NPDC051567]|uniref:tyrosinase family protein n=1 Tax=Streptomyces sp. NPDC051567 TaxID=3365660 RepID=UPI0037A4F639